MIPILLPREELKIGHIASLAISPNGRRMYLGRYVSDDQTPENVAVLRIDPATGTVFGKCMFRDNKEPLPVGFTPPAPRRPRATITAIISNSRYNKLYIAAQHEDVTAHSVHFWSIYDWDAQGVPIADTLSARRLARRQCAARPHRPVAAPLEYSRLAAGDAARAAGQHAAQYAGAPLGGWTGQPFEGLKRSIPAIWTFRHITSVRSGPLNNTSTNKASASVTMPLNDVDVLLLEPA